MKKEHLQISYRDQLPLLLRKLNLVDIGVEIGVQTGIYSEKILRSSILKRLYSIDCWKNFSGYKDIANKNQIKQYLNYIKTILRLFKFGKRSVILRKFSIDSVGKFRNESLDFIYIDAQHSYSGVLEDLNLWWPKLKKESVFAGHDYVNGNFIEGDFGVKTAVDEFIKKENQELFLTNTKQEIDFKWPT